MKVKLPFEPSTLGQVAACAALNDEKHLMEAIKINNSEKLKLESFFKENNMKYIPSVTNFLTLRFSTSNKAENFCNNLLKKGIILRHLAGFGLSECVRVTIGLPNENKYLVNQIKQLEI